MAAQDPTVSTESNGGALVATAATFLALTWFSVILRTYVRAIMLKGFQADDWLMLMAQVRVALFFLFLDGLMEFILIVLVGQLHNQLLIHTRRCPLRLGTTQQITRSDP